MEAQSVIHSTFVIERSYTATPERVFAAFSDPVQKRRWFASSDKHDIEDFHLDFRVGGAERARYRFNSSSPFPGAALTSDGMIHDIVPNRRIVFASTMAIAERRISTTLVTVELLRTDEGTDLILTHQGAFFEGSDGPKMREDGWSQLMDRLGKELARS